MSNATNNTYEMRDKRIKDVVAGRIPDRVPFAPKVGVAYSHTGNISMYEALMNFRNMRDGVTNFLTRYETDLFWNPAGYPANVMEVLGTTCIKWPGPTSGLGLNSGFQILDEHFLQDDEYPEFLKDPSKFFMTKVFPRRHKRLAGLAKMTFDQVVEFGHYASMQAFADPEVRQALLTLMYAGEEAVKWQTACRELCELAVSLNTPLGCIVGSGAPYDMFADNIRGYLNTGIDVFERPDDVLAAIDVMEDIAIKGLDGFKAAGFQYVFIPLHGGTDDFMSQENYEKFYWPSLRRVMDRIIELDMIPYPFFEGKYETRLDFLAENLPKDKTIAMFEQVDIATAKKKLGGVATVCGNLPSALLAYGSKEEIIEQTKRMLDQCAPGGRFIMDCSIVLENFIPENMDAWFETTLKYGNY